MKKVSFVVGVLASVVVGWQAFACESASIVSGEKCEDLKVEFNFEKCSDQKGVKQAARVQCDGNRATAKFYDSANRYEALFTKSEQGWGSGSTWQREGAVKRIPRPVTQNLAPAPERTPAANQDTARIPAPAPQTPEAPKTPEAVSSPISAYLDFLFQWHPRGGSFQVPGRVFDHVANTMSVQWAELSYEKKMQNLKIHVDVAFGEAVQRYTGLTAIPGRGDFTPAPSTTNLANFFDPMNHVPAAYVVYTPDSAPRLSITAGKIYTHVGFEYTKAKDNWNYSRSMSFNFGGPFFHTGVGIGYVLVPDQLTSNLYILNGWDGRITAEQNNTPTYGLNVGWVGVPGLAVNYNLISGTETQDAEAIRQVHELNASYNLNESFTVAVDVLSGTQKRSLVTGTTAEDANWLGVVGYLRWKASEKTAATVRYEEFNDNDGITLASTAFSQKDPARKQKVTGITLTLAQQLTQGTEARLEYYSQSTDKSALGLFKDASGANASSQHTVGLSILSTF